MPDETFHVDWLFASLIAGCLLVWAAIAARLQRRKPLVAREPRTPVPWDGGAVTLTLVMYFAFQLVTVETALTFFGQPQLDDVLETSSDAETAEPAADAEPVDPIDNTESTAHPIARLLGQRRDYGTLALCAVAALVIAPLAEEFFFRLVLQGWLEAREGAWRHRQRWLRVLPRGMLPIALSAIPFALMHLRAAGVDFVAENFTVALISSGASSLATVVFTVILLRWAYGATAADLGFSLSRVPHDVGLGLVAVMAVLAPLLFLQESLYRLELWLIERGAIEEMIAPDPLPLFLLAVVLGFLYRRTHRLTPSVVLHMGFNGTMLLLLLTALKG